MPTSPVGQIGSLAVATRGEQGAGEVVLTLDGATESFLAWSPEPLARNTRVLVLAVRAARSVEVIAFPADADDEQPARFPASELDL